MTGLCSVKKAYMSKSKIEWTEETWNPLIGCDKVSAGCKNCYAIKTAWIRMHNPKMAERYAGVVEKTAAGQLNWTGKVNMINEAFLKPVNQKKPTIYFVNSMSDLFHESVPFEFINAVFMVMSDADHHIYQILTKRPERMVEFFEWKKQEFGIIWQPKPNVWLGVSVEDQKSADNRIPLLLQVPCSIRFLSCEPILGPIEIYKLLAYGEWALNIDVHQTQKLHWVIAGGESGARATPMHPDWVRSLRDQCASAGVAFFFKQWGEYAPYRTKAAYSENRPLMFLEQNGEVSWWAGDDDTTINYSTNYTGNGQPMDKVGKKAAGRLLDGKLYDEYPKLRPNPITGN